METGYTSFADRSVHPVMSRLRRREPIAALGIRSARGPEIARLARAAGYHALWVDLEHSTMPIDAAGAICAAALDLGLAPFARVPERDYGVVGRLLDAGATGIIVPRVETAEQAADAVAACRFPPEGHRSAIGSLPLFDYRRLPAAELHAAANRATVVELLIESPRGIANIEAIAAVEGVDLIAIGSNDLGAELGVAGDALHPLLRQAHDRALEACARAGKPLVIGGVADSAYAAELIRRGAAPFLMAGIDTELLLAALHDKVAQALASIAQEASR